MKAIRDYRRREMDSWDSPRGASMCALLPAVGSDLEQLKRNQEQHERQMVELCRRAELELPLKG